MNEYEKNRLLKSKKDAEKAKKLKEEAIALSEYDRQEMSHYPMVQPILIDHHSEKRDRKNIKRSWARNDKVATLFQVAEHYDERANVIDNHIS